MSPSWEIWVSMCGILPETRPTLCANPRRSQTSWRRRVVCTNITLKNWSHRIKYRYLLLHFVYLEVLIKTNKIYIVVVVWMAGLSWYQLQGISEESAQAECSLTPTQHKATSGKWPRWRAAKAPLTWSMSSARGSLTLVIRLVVYVFVRFGLD